MAHPDDIEFVAAGTLLQLAARGWEIHYFDVANGNCGSTMLDLETCAATRLEEARAAAVRLGAVFHPPIADDLMVFYNEPLLRKVAAVIRRVNPRVILTHAEEDYMEDHMNTARLAVTAAFTRGMPNFVTDPELPPVDGQVAIYHATPHGLRTRMGEPVRAAGYVDTTAVHARKRHALECHASQKEWLDVSQGMDSYLVTCDEASRRVGALSGRFTHAEGWRRHLPIGFGDEDFDPLAEELADIWQPDPGATRGAAGQA